MSPVNGEIWLQTEQANGTFVCESFSGVPVARPSWIALVSAGSAEGRAAVAELRQELVAVLLGASPGVKQSTMTCPANPDAMLPEQYPGRRKLLVLVGSTDAKFTNRLWYEQWESDAHAAAIMTVLPPGDFTSFFDAVIAANNTHLLRRVNANRWHDKIAETVPGILARSEITGGVARVFISYRRLETLPIALQLFDRLGREDFNVFLDQFSIPPGYDFQRRLTQELEDKSMVLLLESNGLKDSKWSQHEIDFARRYRLGLYSLRMPDLNPANSLLSAHAHPFLKLDAAKDLTAGPQKVTDADGNQFTQWQTLCPTTLERVVTELKRAHATALFERRQRLRDDLVTELKKAGVKTQYAAAGPLLAQYGPDEHLLWPATRPPEVDDFQQTHMAHHARPISGKSRGIVIGPQAAQEPDRLARLEWLQKVSGCPIIDEGKLADFAQQIIKGTLP